MVSVFVCTKRLAVVPAAMILALSACVESARSAKTSAPLLQMTAPTGYAHASVILIGDPRASEELVWADGNAQISVPSSGIVRLKSLGLINSEPIEAQLGGKDYWRVGAANLGDTRVAMFRFSEGKNEPAINLLLESELAKYLSERESESGTADQALR